MLSHSSILLYKYRNDGVIVARRCFPDVKQTDELLNSIHYQSPTKYSESIQDDISYLLNMWTRHK